MLIIYVHSCVTRIAHITFPYLSRLRKCNVGWQPVCWGKNLLSLIAGLLESTGSLWPGRTSIRVPHSCTVEDQLVIYCQKVLKPRRQAFQTELWMKKEGAFGNQQNGLRNQKYRTTRRLCLLAGLGRPGKSFIFSYLARKARSDWPRTLTSEETRGK